MARPRKNFLGHTLTNANIRRDNATGKSRLTIEGDAGYIKVLVDPADLVGMFEEARHNEGVIHMNVKLLMDEIPRLLQEARAVSVYIPGRRTTAGELTTDDCPEMGRAAICDPIHHRMK
jgi:hypothetical protein